MSAGPPWSSTAASAWPFCGPRALVASSCTAPVAVLPVNFVLDGEQVVIRTGEGSILAAARSGALVTFQADAIEESEGGRGWSVTVAGPAREATGTVLNWLTELPLAPIAGGTREHYVLVPAESTEGRWVGAPRSGELGR